MQRLEDENPDEADAIRVQERPDDAETQPWHNLYWEAWEALRYDRPYGAMGGEGSIPYQALSRYAADHEISGDDFRLFRTFMNAIDTEWLEHVAREAKKKEAEK